MPDGAGLCTGYIYTATCVFTSTGHELYMVTHAHNGYTCYHVQWTLDVHGEKFPTLDVRGKVYRLEGYIIHRLTKRHGVSSHAQFNDGCAIKQQAGPLVKTHKVVFVLHSYPHLLPTPLSLRQIPAFTLL